MGIVRKADDDSGPMLVQRLAPRFLGALQPEKLCVLLVEVPWSRVDAGAAKPDPVTIEQRPGTHGDAGGANFGGCGGRFGRRRRMSLETVGKCDGSEPSNRPPIRRYTSHGVQFDVVDIIFTGGPRGLRRLFGSQNALIPLSV